MRRSTRSRRPSGNTRTKRLLAVGATLAVFGGVVAVTQISSAGDRRPNKQQTRPISAECVEPSPGATAPTARGATTTRTFQNGRWVTNHWGDGQQSVEECQETRSGNGGATPAGSFAVACPDVVSRLPQVPDRARAEVDRNLALLQTQITEADQRLAAEGNKGQAFIRNAILDPLASKRRATLDRITISIDRFGPRPRGLAGLAACQVQPVNNNNGGNNGGNNPNNGGNNGGGNNNGGNNGGGNNGLDVLANNCNNSQLQPHDGFQNGNRCISTAFGEVGSAANNPSLLITEFPQQINRNEGFALRVSTRNLVRDRFLPAGQGGYYLESSLLNGEGLTRGHFHTACRMLNNTNEAPAADPVPAFFVATEDGGGGSQPDSVVIQIPGLPESGTAQCAVWAGDGSHRIPMSERANQTPAFDAVRIQVN
ncbi:MULTISPECIES: hypothetical protein [unclassified Micromonospora]|uniref:hypothetical protein n=1 Tax=unclassified Micromonospora TaxID=2617518 RepID=UPI001590CA0D|nr:hypothetical protein [Verrucosispora sp. NA02020]QKW14914.1 hypothetical protein HUT12_20465 [Verrucosispora sp. NA02020]